MTEKLFDNKVLLKAQDKRWHKQRGIPKKQRRVVLVSFGDYKKQREKQVPPFEGGDGEKL